MMFLTEILALTTLLTLGVTSQKIECLNGEWNEECFCVNDTYSCFESSCSGHQCIKGENMIDGCDNKCFCNDKGHWTCTEKACKKERPKDCKEGQVRVTADEKCRCYKGRWACSKDYCVEKKKRQCVSGSEGTKLCNQCFCASGYWGCTKIGCPPPLSEHDAKEGMKIEDGCNIFTFKNGRWDVTDNVCPNPKPVILDCFQGETRRDGCNQFTCSGGTWISTTHQACLVPVEGKDCKEGNIYADDDKVCRCINKYWSCSQKKCLDEICSPLNSLEPIPPKCESCACSPDGTQNICTNLESC